MIWLAVMVGRLVARRMTAAGFAAVAIQRLGMKANCTSPGTGTQCPIDSAVTQATEGMLRGHPEGAVRIVDGAAMELAKPKWGREPVAETSGDTVVLETARGRVEVRRMGRAESGSSRWQVAFP